MMKLVLFVVIGSLILFSCGKQNDNRTPGDYLSAFTSANPNIVAFGKIDIDQLLKKSDVRNLPKVGLILSGYLTELSGAVNLKTPIHFALEGPFDSDGAPSAIYAFIETLNADTLAAKITQQGYDMEEDRGMYFFQDGDLAFGTKNNLAVIISRRENFNAKRMLTKVFDDSKRALAGGEIDEIINSDADIVAGVSMRNLYQSSNTDLKDLSEEKRREVDEMVKDSYFLTTVNFEEGQIAIQTKNLFSEALMQKMFFRTDDRAEIVKRLGSGKPTIGLSMHLDMPKMQDFIETYSPNTLRDLGESVGGPLAIMMAMGGKNMLSNLLTGEFGAVMVGSPNMQEGVPDVNFFVGLGKQGQLIAEQGKVFLEAMGMQEVRLEKDGLWVSSNKAYSSSSGGELQLPIGCKDFGTKGIHLFVNLNGVDLSAFEFENEQKLIYLMQYINFGMDNHGSTLLIKAKKDNQNILKQVIGLLFKELESKIGGLTS